MTPSKEALKLAANLLGHVHGNAVACAHCNSWAETIDHELQLPQRSVALLLAQAAVDIADRTCKTEDGFGAMLEVIDELRDALAAIKR